MTKKKKVVPAKKSGATTKKSPSSKPAVAAKSQGAQKKGDAKGTTSKVAGSSNGSKAKPNGTPKKSVVSQKTITVQVKSPKNAEIVVKSPAKPKTLDAHNIVLQVPANRVPVNKVVKSADEARAKRAAETKKENQNKREAMMNKARAATKSTSLSERFSQSGSR